MSNAAVGPIYEAIIQEVVNAVRVDFEENGVDEGVLEDLKKVSIASLSISPFPVANSLLRGFLFSLMSLPFISF